MMASLQFRTDVLKDFGATATEVEELLTYNQNLFDWGRLPEPLILPMPTEPHSAIWEEYQLTAQNQGVYETLRQCLPQLQFPIRAGMSQGADYRAATLRCIPTEGLADATGLELERPDQLELWLHPTLAGSIPVLFTPCRADFVMLVQALSRRNEPEPIPDAMGACLVTGFNNCDRILRYRQRWETGQFGSVSEADWATEFGRLIPRKELYQDRFIILSAGAYSNVSAADLGLAEVEWRSLSSQIRLEHECTHYLTQRLFGSMRNNVLDELIADYRGLVAAIERFRADWFLRFMGLEEFPEYREGGRLGSYRGTPPLSERAFRILQALVKVAAAEVETVNQECGESGSEVLWMGLTLMTLEELASQESQALIRQRMAIARSKLDGLGDTVQPCIGTPAPQTWGVLRTDLNPEVQLASNSKSPSFGGFRGLSVMAMSDKCNEAPL